MAGIQEAKNNFRSTINQVGKAATNALFPKDFEYYLISLELVNSDGDTVDFFSFPIMPESITETKQEIKNVKKTAGGITTLDTSTFVPRNITLNGTFGRQFKVTLGSQFYNDVVFAGINFSTKTGAFSKEDVTNPNITVPTNNFSTLIKTGYGCIKVLEAIVDKASALDNKNRPFFLYLYNQALGSNYLVEPISFNQTQSYDSNTLWYYNLNLKAVGRVEDIRTMDIEDSITRNLAADQVTKQVQSFASGSGIRAAIGV